MRLKCCTLAACLGLFSLSALADGVVATIHSDTSRSSEADAVISLSFTNEKSSPVKLLKWVTPQNGIDDNLFRVTENGQEVRYLGRYVKRAPPQEKDYTNLQPGETIEFQVNLSGLYDFSSTGNFQIQYLAEKSDMVKPETSQKQTSPGSDETQNQIQSNTISLRVAPTLTDRDYLMEDLASASNGIPYTVGCSEPEQTSVWQAFKVAKGLADDSVYYLSDSSHYFNDRFKVWFGGYTNTRRDTERQWDTARQHFLAIQNVLKNKTVVFDCRCTDDSYAYVIVSRPYRIYLCNDYWGASTSGTDSKGGVIIHELSHFDVAGGTGDFAYGQYRAKQLPSQLKIRNADNHEYFAENNPYLD